MRTIVQKPNQPQKQSSSRLAQAKSVAPVEALRLKFPGTPTPCLGTDFSRIPVHPRGLGALQAKLAINTPGDEYEQEADRISGQVMRMPEPRLPRSHQEQDRLQTRSVQAGGARETLAPPIVHDVLSSPGRPLDATARAFFEPRFGYDFSQVRV